MILRVALDEPWPLQGHQSRAATVLVAALRCIDSGADPEGLAERLAEITSHRRPTAETRKLAILQGVLQETEWLRDAPFELQLSSTIFRRYREYWARVDELEQALDEGPILHSDDEDAVAVLHALLLLIDGRLHNDPRVRDVDGQPFDIEHDSNQTLVMGDTVTVRLTHRSGECERGLNQLLPPDHSGCDRIEIDIR